MAKLLILGAGIYQVPLINKAKKLGHYVIVVSVKGKYPGFNLADKIYYVDTTDKESVLCISKKENIDGILTTGTDVAISTIGFVCDKLGLKGLSYKSAMLSTDKTLMKDAFMNNNVITAKYRVCHDIVETQEVYEQFSKPVILKAVDSSGSRGIVKVNKKDELEDAVRNVMLNTKKDYFIIEEFIEGEEFGAQSMVANGEVVFILPHGDYVFQGETGVPIGHFAPYDIDTNLLQDIQEQIENTVKALEIDNAALNIDFILKDNKPYMLEIGARAGATCLVELVSIFYNIDYYKMLIDIALGNKVEMISDEKIANASMLLYSEKDGVIVSQRDCNKNDFIYEVVFDYKIGEKVRKFNVGPDRIGHVVVKGNDLNEAETNLKTALKNIQIKIE